MSTAKFIKTKFLVAAKSHTCCECGCEIKKKVAYKHLQGSWKGEVVNSRLCVPCHSFFASVCQASNHIGVETPKFNKLHHWIYENGFLVHGINWESESDQFDLVRYVHRFNENNTTQLSFKTGKLQSMLSSLGVVA